MGMLTTIIGITSILIGFLCFGVCFYMFVANHRARVEAREALFEAWGARADGVAAAEMLELPEDFAPPHSTRMLRGLFIAAIFFMTVVPVVLAVGPAAIINTH